jgi:trehalose 6-phosphate synthase
MIFDSQEKRMSFVEMFTSSVETGRKPECIIASNRGPVEYYFDDGQYKMRLGSGGLVTALLNAIQHRRISWIALTMTMADRQGSQAHQQASADILPPAFSGISLNLLSIPEQAYDKYYYSISNHILWFAQHGLLEPVAGTTFTQQTRDDWDNGYCVANEAVANAVIKELKTWGSETPVIFQDYQLYLAAGLVRARCPGARLGHVIYIPWPDARYLAMLPDYMVQSIYRSMSMNDFIGFQTLNDARNFLSGAARFLTGAQVRWDDTSRSRPGVLLWQGRTISICLSPVMLSPEYFHSVMQSQEVKHEKEALQSQLRLREHGQLVVRVDRIEPTKNIVRGFQAYERMLERHPELCGRVTFLALLVPSRESLENYRLYEREVRDIIARINARYGRSDWQPVIAIFDNNRARALVGLQNYDVLLVNPVIDGMNLVVKEGGLLNQHSGVIVLSRTVGVHDTLGDYVLSITPLDIDATAETIYHALTMPPEERVHRADQIQRLLLGEDATQWFDRQIQELCNRLASQESLAS